MEEFRKPEEITTIELLELEFKKVFLIVDEGVIRMSCACVIANRMDLDPVWLLLVTSSSGGKTEIISSFSKLEFIHPISDLTVNTFASGQKKTGVETSLLMKIQNGIMTFKDFTSVMSKDKEAKKAIMSQLREIFDGEYVKRTGTGDDIVWRGKVGALAGSTEAVYRHLEDMTEMGDRFIMYSIDQPDRIEVSKRAMDNTHDMASKREHLKDCVRFFIEHVIKSIDNEDIVLKEEVRDELLEVADFATRVRSAVMVDFKTGLPDFVPSAEMPMRMTQQLYTLAHAFIAMDKAGAPERKGEAFELTELERRLLYRTAFDSIPRTRRDVLFPLAEFRGGVSSAGMAVHLNLPTSSTTKYLMQINALKICKRVKSKGANGDNWILPDNYRNILLKIRKMEVKDAVLTTTEIMDEEDAWAQYDQIKAEQENREQDTLGVLFD